LGWSNGRIMVEEAYAQGKMIDHSSWVLDRGCNFCDVDMLLDSKGCCFWCFLERTKNRKTLSKGQRIVFDTLSNLNGYHIAAVLRHSVDVKERINSRFDIQEAEVWFDRGQRQVLLNNEQYQRLVCAWATNPYKALNRLRLNFNQNGRNHSKNKKVIQMKHNQFEMPLI